MRLANTYVKFATESNFYWIDLRIRPRVRDQSTTITAITFAAPDSVDNLVGYNAFETNRLAYRDLSLHLLRKRF